MPGAALPSNALSRTDFRSPAEILQATVHSNLKRKLANRSRDFLCAQTGLRETIPAMPQPNVNRLQMRVSKLARKVQRALSVSSGPRHQQPGRAWTGGTKPNRQFLSPTFDSTMTQGLTYLPKDATRAPWGDMSCAESRIKPWRDGSPLLTTHGGKSPWQVRKEENMYATELVGTPEPRMKASEAAAEMLTLQTRASELEGQLGPSATAALGSRPGGPEYAPKQMNTFAPRHSADLSDFVPGYSMNPSTHRSSLPSSRYSATARSSMASSRAPTLYGVNVQNTEWERQPVSMIYDSYRGQSECEGGTMGRAIRN